MGSCIILSAPNGHLNYIYRRLVLGALLSVAVLLPQALSADGTPEWRQLPWHLMDWHHTLPQGYIFESLAVEFVIEQAPQPGDFIFFAVLMGSLGGQQFYLGLQTDLYDGLSRQNLGEGLIYSRWGGQDPLDGRAPLDGWVVIPNQNTAKEGIFVSVRRPFSWDVGRYTFLLKAHPFSYNEPVWVDLLVYDHQHGRWYDGGGLRFDEPRPVFHPSTVTFLEVYGKHNGDPEHLPRIGIRLHGPVLNGDVMPSGGRPSVPKGVPHVANADRSDGILHITLEPLQQ